MSAPSILEQLQSAGLAVECEGDRLTVKPKELLTDELRQAIRDHKSEIMLLLTVDDCDGKCRTCKTPCAPRTPEEQQFFVSEGASL